MKLRIVVLGAGFGGLELTALLSEALADDLDLTLIDKSGTFIYGYSKLDVMFGHKTPDAVRIAYRNIVKPGVRFVQETITAIDPTARRVTTYGATYDSDVLVVALGAEYDVSATPGLAEGGNEFYSVAGAERLRDILPTFTKGNAVIGITSSPVKATGSSCEVALLLEEYLTTRGVRAACTITLVMPSGAPIPPSPDASHAFLSAFAEHGITFVPNHSVRALDPARHVAILDDATELPYDLFLGVPKHRVPAVVAASGMTEKGWIPVNPKTLETKFPGVYAIGDVTSIGTPKTGGFAASAAQALAAELIAEYKGTARPGDYDGAGSGYIEFGESRVGRMDLNFFSEPKPTSSFSGPSIELAEEKEQLESERTRRWFGL